jgi:hypothetical protein
MLAICNSTKRSRERSRSPSLPLSREILDDVLPSRLEERAHNQILCCRKRVYANHIPKHGFDRMYAGVDGFCWVLETTQPQKKPKQKPTRSGEPKQPQKKPQQKPTKFGSYSIHAAMATLLAIPHPSTAIATDDDVSNRHKRRRHTRQRGHRSRG